LIAALDGRAGASTVIPIAKTARRVSRLLAQAPLAIVPVESAG
jgi:hypothetical protein